MQRGDLGFLVSRVLAVLTALDALRTLLALGYTVGITHGQQPIPALLLQIAYVVALGVAPGFLWFRAYLLSGPPARTKISITNPSDFQSIAFGTVGLYFLISGVATLLDDLWWDVLAKSDLTEMFHQHSSYVDEIARTAIGGIVLLLSSSKLGK